MRWNAPLPTAAASFTVTAAFFDGSARCRKHCTRIAPLARQFTIGTEDGIGMALYQLFKFLAAFFTFIL